MASEIGIPFPLLRDADLKVANAYGVAMNGKDIALPAVFVISRDGRIVFKAIGENPADPASSKPPPPRALPEGLRLTRHKR